MRKPKSIKIGTSELPPEPILPEIEAIDYGIGSPDSVAIEVMCLNCHRMIRARDWRENICEECYFWLQEEMSDLDRRARQRPQRPLFHVP